MFSKKYVATFQVTFGKNRLLLIKTCSHTGNPLNVLKHLVTLETHIFNVLNIVNGQFHSRASFSFILVFSTQPTMIIVLIVGLIIKKG